MFILLCASNTNQWNRRQQWVTRKPAKFSRCGDGRSAHLSKEDDAAREKHRSEGSESHVRDGSWTEWSYNKGRALRDRHVKQPVLVHGILYLCLVALLRIELIVVFEIGYALS